MSYQKRILTKNVFFFFHLFFFFFFFWEGCHHTHTGHDATWRTGPSSEVAALQPLWPLRALRPSVRKSSALHLINHVSVPISLLQAVYACCVYVYAHAVCMCMYMMCVLYRKKFSSAKNFVKSDRLAVRQKFIFVKRRLSLVALRSFGRRSVAYRSSSHSWVFLIPHL